MAAIDQNARFACRWLFLLPTPECLNEEVQGGCCLWYVEQRKGAHCYEWPHDAQEPGMSRVSKVRIEVGLQENSQLVPQLQGLVEEHPQLPAILIELFGG